MPRVFSVTFTKTFDLTILAESEAKLLEALHGCRYEIDQWNTPDPWDFETSDPLKMKRLPLPDEVPEFDMALVGKEFLSVGETGSYKERIDELRGKAQEELDRMHLEKVQMPLPFGK